MINLLEIAAAAGASATVVPHKEGWRLLQSWREVYCVPVYEATGKWGRFAWETFGGGHFPALHGRRALNEYSAQPCAELLVIPDSDHVSAIRCTNDAAIHFTGLGDIYVAPSSFEWTMVFTHEGPDIGPYFSRAAWRHGIA